MDPQPPPFGPPDPYAAWQHAPSDPYAPPPMAAPRGPSYVPFLVVGLVLALVATAGLVTVAWRASRGGAYQVAVEEKFDVAECGPVVDDPLPAVATHSEGRVDYGPQPPSSGRHNPVPLPRSPRVVPYDSAPALVAERAVHNLEHAYVVVWYDPSPGLERAVTSIMRAVSAPKVLAVPWTRGSFDGYAAFVLTAWGHRQTCSFATPQVIDAFYARYGGMNGDAPEKSAP